MLILSLILIPALAGIVAFSLKAAIPRRLMLVSVGLLHVTLTTTTWFLDTETLCGGWIQLDPLGRLFLTVISVLFAASAVSLYGKLRHPTTANAEDAESGLCCTRLEMTCFERTPYIAKLSIVPARNIIHGRSDIVLTGCLLFLLSSMTCVTVCQHLGLLWLILTATTLTSIPLTHARCDQRSREIVRKHLPTCLGGITIALMGNFLLARSAAQEAAAPVSLVVSELILNASLLDVVWLRVAFLFFVVGYGVSLGLAPLHSWVLAAQSEATPAVAALFSGALVNCVFLALLRILQVCHAAGLQSDMRPLLISFGLLSLFFAWCLLVGTRDIPRVLASFCVGNMGIQVFGIGLGGIAVSGTLLQVVSTSLIRGMLVMAAMNIMQSYRTRSLSEVSGLQQTRPWSGTVWMLGCLALVGLPPFAPFYSQFTILKGAIDNGHYLAGGVYLALLTGIMISAAGIVLRMSRSAPHPISLASEFSRDWTSIGPPFVLGLLVVVLSFYIPQQLTDACREAALTLGGSGW